MCYNQLSPICSDIEEVRTSNLKGVDKQEDESRHTLA
jgi:hypothetical protein